MGCGEVEGAGGESGGEENHVCHHSLLCTLLPTLADNNIIPFVSVVRPHRLEHMFRHCTTTIFIGLLRLGIMLPFVL